MRIITYPEFKFYENSKIIKRTICTGKSLSEALIFASTIPQYDDRLFIELRVQYMKIPSSEHVVYTNCFLFWHSEQFMDTTCSEIGIFMYWTCNNLLSYCGLVDASISASEKDLPVSNKYLRRIYSFIYVFIVLGDHLDLPHNLGHSNLHFFAIGHILYPDSWYLSIWVLRLSYPTFFFISA